MLARLALAGIASYVIIDVILAFLRPEYSLIYNAESDYGRGPWFWLMDLNFLLRCALSLAVVGALAKTSRLVGHGRFGLLLVAVWAFASGLLAFFADDIEGQPQHGSGVVHLALAAIAFSAITAGAIRVSVQLLVDPIWHSRARVLLAISLAGAVGYVLLGAALKHHHGADGLFERIFLGLELLWLATVAVAIVRRARVPDRSVREPDAVTRPWPDVPA